MSVIPILLSIKFSYVLASIPVSVYMIGYTDCDHLYMWISVTGTLSSMAFATALTPAAPIDHSHVHLHV